MGNKNSRVELEPEMLEKVAGGSIGFNPDGSGTYTMICEYSGDVYYGIALSDVIEIGKFGATVTDTPEGEQELLQWARDRGII